MISWTQIVTALVALAVVGFVVLSIHRSAIKSLEKSGRERDNRA